MVAIGVFLALIFGCIWVLTHTWWHEMDPQDPGKILATEIMKTGRMRLKEAGKGLRLLSRRGGEQEAGERE